ncbi:FluC/FEX family fluoride channel [Tessaracoccus caeni]|uniref:FluC/FEX family fluoride channel n=1 Tax=Tessaracoccus caeni TaxID=3031239 RepID=UPI0023D9D10D|nr:CrcB family protein [Tessaracoccus caeni]MDF1489081.1 CrcB family protein [Tessaracoccus caeni]
MRVAQTLVVFVGGAIGTLIRAVLQAAWPATGWPWATFLINLTGSFLLGLLLTALVRNGGDAGWRRFVRLGVGTGLLGGYTTYSAFIMEGEKLASSGGLLMAGAYLMGSIALGAAAAAAGILLARRVVPHHAEGAR